MHIILGITGSIAAYKSCTLLRLLVKAGHEVQVVMTPSAKEFITPLTLATLSRKPVVSDFFDRRDGSWHSHVDMSQWADMLIVAPASASTIAKMTHGIADNILITTYLAQRPDTPVIVCPAMDLDMYSHEATQANLQKLHARSHHYVVEPAEGELASLLVGKGRMQEPEVIADFVGRYFAEQQRSSQPLYGKRVLITAGPTHEPIDPVRFIGNASSGRMGFALAEAFAVMGAEVELVAGPVACTTHQPHITRHDVMTAEQMHSACLALFPQCDGAVLCAAVADFTYPHAHASKLKREGSGGLNLSLVPTQDIAAALGQMKREDQRLVGFALESDDGEANAKEKMQRKHFDFIALNSMQHSNPIGSDSNDIVLLFADGRREASGRSSKAVWAQRIAAHFAALFTMS